MVERKREKKSGLLIDIFVVRIAGEIAFKRGRLLRRRRKRLPRLGRRRRRILEAFRPELLGVEADEPLGYGELSSKGSASGRFVVALAPLFVEVGVRLASHGAHHEGLGAPPLRVEEASNGGDEALSRPVRLPLQQRLPRRSSVAVA